MYSDASFSNILNERHCIPQRSAKKLTKLKQVARSTLTADTLVFTEKPDCCPLHQSLGQESKLVSTSTQTDTLTNNNSLYECASITSQIAYKRSRVEMSN